MILVEADTSEEWDSRGGWAELSKAGICAAVASSRYRGLIDSPLRVEVSVRFTGNAEVQGLNAAWRGKNTPTNVLSFPMVQAEHLPALAQAEVGEMLLGDIVLAHGICSAEAVDKGISIESHAAHLVVHGTLHLLGYDHEQDTAQAEAMEKLEREALAGLGIADPYLSEVRS